MCPAVCFLSGNVCLGHQRNVSNGMNPWPKPAARQEHHVANSYFAHIPLVADSASFFQRQQLSWHSGRDKTELPIEHFSHKPPHRRPMTHAVGVLTKHLIHIHGSYHGYLKSSWKDRFASKAKDHSVLMFSVKNVPFVSSRKMGWWVACSLWNTVFFYDCWGGRVHNSSLNISNADW